MTARSTWRDLLQNILTHGFTVRQDRRTFEPRDTDTMEILGYQTRWDMARPLVRCPIRKIGTRFAAAEPAWILSGSNLLEDVARYAPHLRTFSDDGVRLAGAYGPKFVDQLPYVVACLKKDPQSRQAVSTTWRERPGPSRDVACTVSLQWLVRDGVLHCSVYMRSSDAWLGIPYDVVAFSAMSAAVAIEAGTDVVSHLGTLILTCGSQHLYKRDATQAASCAESIDEPDECTGIVLSEFGSTADLIGHLRGLAARDPCVSQGWLRELIE